jgi:low affinity Fe/Cu permease
LWLVSTLVAIGVVVVFGTLFGFSRLGMLVSLPFSIASLVLFVVYWIQVVSYRRQLERDRDQDDERDFDDDDRLRLPSRPDDRIR